MVDISKQIAIDYKAIKDAAVSLDSIKEIETFEEFMREHGKLYATIRSLYLLIHSIADNHQILRELYDSQEYFAKKEINMFMSEIKSLVNEFGKLMVNMSIKGFETWNSYLIKVPYITFDIKLQTDIDRLRFFAKFAIAILYPIVREYDKIVGVIKNSHELAEKQSCLYM